MRERAGGGTRRLDFGGEEGFSLLELMAALTILSFGFFALAGAASTGARLLAEGRQRQAAAEIASRQLEHLRNVPFDQLALTTQLIRSTDPENPDYFVADNGLGYDHTGSGSHESLVVHADGDVAHTEPFTVGSTALTAYQYVTWVNDSAVAGSQDYKRVTIVVAYATPVNTGRPTQVRASALITEGSVVVGGSAVAAGQGTIGTPSPSPSASATGSCSNDTQGPTGDFTIVSGTGATVGYTASTTATISLSPSDACGPITVQFSNNNVTYGASFAHQASDPTATWTLTAGEGTKQVWTRYKDGLGNTRTLGPKTIVVDSTRPGAPGNLSRSVSCSANQRTISLSWSAASDANLLGYRLYRSVDGGAYEPVATSSATADSNTHSKLFDSVRFKVVAYDKAGNEGSSSSEISLAKNQCS